MKNYNFKMDDEIIKRSILYRDLERQNKKLEDEIKKLTQYTRKRKNYFESTNNQKYNIRTELANSMAFSNQLANTVGLKIRKVIVTEKEAITENQFDICVENKGFENYFQAI